MTGLIQPGMALPTLPNAHPAPAPAPAAQPAAKAELIDINHASKDELDALPGIGAVRADAIIKGRPYRGKDDLVSKKVIPQNVYDGIKDKVMGSTEHGKHVAGDTVSTVQDKASDTMSTVQDKASSAKDATANAARSAADSVRNAPQAVAQQAQGNPLAAGIIAFGVGMLAATLIPVTDAERRAGQEIKDRGGDLADKAKDLANEVKDDLAEPVQQAVGEVKSTAQDAAQTTKQQAQSSAQDATEQVRG